MGAVLESAAEDEEKKRNMRYSEDKMKKMWKLAPALLAIFAALSVSSSTPKSATPKGALCIIGGGLKSDNSELYGEMIRLAGGAKELKIAVIAAGSVEPVGTFRSLIADFGLYGVEAERIRLLPIAVADDPLTPDCDESAWSKNGFSATVAASFTDCGLIFFFRWRSDALSPDSSGREGFRQPRADDGAQAI